MISPRQRQVIALAGHGVKGTADLLGLTPNTVAGYRKAALRRLGASSMIEAREILRERDERERRRKAPVQDTTLGLVEA